MAGRGSVWFESGLAGFALVWLGTDSLSIWSGASSRGSVWFGKMLLG